MLVFCCLSMVCTNPVYSRVAVFFEEDSVCDLEKSKSLDSIVFSDDRNYDNDRIFDRMIDYLLSVISLC